MNIQYNTWVDVCIPWIKDNTIRVSPEGRVTDFRGSHNPSYLSSNGYLYEFVHTTDGRYVLKPFDIIMALTFVPIPGELKGKPIKVRHKNSRPSDCDYQNLEWIEDVEEWRPVEYNGVRQGTYQISNLGRIRSMSTEPPTIMKTEKGEYERVTLVTTQGNQKHYSIHRLVAFSFVDGYCVGKQVNHIDGCKWNNNCINLEWITQSGNIKHAYDSGLLGKGDQSSVTKISESDVVIICQALNKNKGCLIDTFNDVKHMIPSLTYPMVGAIKYGETFSYISNVVLNEDGRRKQIRQTDPDVILEAAQCLKKYNGDVKKTKKEFIINHPWVTYSWLWHLKDKTVASEITDMVFAKDEFPKTTPLTEDDVLIIIHSLMNHVGDPYVNQTVFDELKDRIPGLTKDKIRSIKEKKSWKSLSDKYFDKSLFM